MSKKHYLVFKVIGKVMNSGFPCKDHIIETTPRFFDTKDEAKAFIVKETDPKIKYLVYYLIEAEYPIKLKKYDVR